MENQIAKMSIITTIQMMQRKTCGKPLYDFDCMNSMTYAELERIRNEEIEIYNKSLK